MKRRLVSIVIAGMTLMLDLPTYAREPEPAYQEYLEDKCVEYHICYEFAESIVFYESSWTPEAKNGSCKGLFQVDDRVWEDKIDEMGITDIYDPYQNIDLGMSILNYYFTEYEDAALVLDAYSGQLHSEDWYTEGNMTSYSKKILKRSEQKERENGK